MLQIEESNSFYEFESCSEEITVHPGSSIKRHLALVYGFYHVVPSPQDYQRTGFIKLESRKVPFETFTEEKHF